MSTPLDYALPATHTFAEWNTALEPKSPGQHYFRPRVHADGAVAWFLLAEAAKVAAGSIFSQSRQWLAPFGVTSCSINLPDELRLSLPAKPLNDPFALEPVQQFAKVYRQQLLDLGVPERYADAMGRRFPAYMVSVLPQLADRVGVPAWEALLDRPSNYFSSVGGIPFIKRGHLAAVHRYLAEGVLGAPFSRADVAVPLRASKHLPDGQVLEVDPLADLQAWLEKPTAQDALRILTGPAGSGRTTTAMQVAANVPSGVRVEVQDLAPERKGGGSSMLFHPWFQEDYRDSPGDWINGGCLSISDRRQLVIIDNADALYGTGRLGRGACRQMIRQFAERLAELNANGLHTQVLMICRSVQALDYTRLAMRSPDRNTATRLLERVQTYLPSARRPEREQRLECLLHDCVMSADGVDAKSSQQDAALALASLKENTGRLFTAEVAYSWLRRFAATPPTYELHMDVRRVLATMTAKELADWADVATLSRWSDGLPVQIALPQEAGVGYVKALVNTQLGILSVLQAACLATGKPRKPARTPSLGAYLNRLLDYHDLTDYLAGLDLSGAELTGLDFSGFDLRGTSFAEASLCGARLGDADLAGADLSAADLTEADLRHANLEGANLRGARLMLAMLDGASFTNAHLERADLSGQDFSGQTFDFAFLEGAVLRRTRFRDASLRNAHLEGADLRGADLSKARLTDTNLVGADLRDARLIDANLKGARLTGARLDNANLQGAILRKADVRETILDKR